MSRELTYRQRKVLRSAANRLPGDVIVGKGGVSEQVAGHLRALLARRELIKVRLLRSAGQDRSELADQLARAASAAVVDLVGRVVVLYKPNEQLPQEERVPLPPC